MRSLGGDGQWTTQGVGRHGLRGHDLGSARSLGGSGLGRRSLGLVVVGDAGSRLGRIRWRAVGRGDIELASLTDEGGLGIRVEDELDGGCTDAERLTVGERARLDPLVAHPHPIPAARVVQHDAGIGALEAGMLARRRLLEQHHVARLVAPQGDRSSVPLEHALVRAHDRRANA